MRSLFLSLVLACVVCASASAQDGRDGLNAVLACPAQPDSPTPPDFTASTCERVPLAQLDPQGRDLWVRAQLPGPAISQAAEGPIGLHLAMKAASEVWLNGARLGANGRPGPDRASEQPGRLNAVIFVPRDQVSPGTNTLDLRLSSHHGLVTLARPVHWIEFGPYRDPTRSMLSRYAPSLLMLSVFLAGLAVFLVSTWRGPRRSLSAVNAGISASAALQLSAEVSRGLIAYPYPVHDVRLIAITVLAGVFGALIIAHVLIRLTRWSTAWRLALMAACVCVFAGLALSAATFDAKAALVLIAAFGAATLIGLFAALRGRRAGWLYAGAGALGTGLALTQPSPFLDWYVYAMGAALVTVLMIEQAFALGRERARRILEAVRARDLAAALARAEQAAHPARLALPSAGRTEYVSTSDIAQLRGAGDYVEVVFTSGRTALFTTTLAKLEAALPATFLRVHRSAIVNTALAERLDRDAGGGGRLKLTGGGQAPVSRRIMPRVKAALNAAR